MIKFFRHIRQTLIMENKTSKYLKYALGEIVLVVIGILIALQINNWNIKRLDHDKQYKYLIEIKNNLNSDVLKIEEVLDFNQTKDTLITESIKMLDVKKTIPGPQIFGSQLDILGSYDKFRPNDLGFKNLISADNISLIENDSLRKLLLEYYSFDFETGVQRRVEELTRKFIDYLLPKITTKEQFLNRNNVELDLPSNNDVYLKNDQQLIAYLELMQVVSRFQNNLLIDKKSAIERLIDQVQIVLKHSKW